MWTLFIITNRSLKRSRYHTPCGLLGAGEQGQEGDEQRQDRVAGDDDGVGGHAGVARVPEERDDKSITFCWVLFSNKQPLLLGQCSRGKRFQIDNKCTKNAFTIHILHCYLLYCQKF